jgi:hypothetical protein
LDKPYAKNMDLVYHQWSGNDGICRLPQTSVQLT